MNIFEYTYLIWFFIGLGFFVLEISAPGFIVFFFGLGSWIVAITLGLLKINLNLNEQIILFVVTSLISLILLRAYLKNIFYGDQRIRNFKKDTDNENMHAIVSKTIKANEFGEIKFKGTFYQAKSNATIKEGTSVRVLNSEDKETNFYKVEKIEEK